MQSSDRRLPARRVADFVTTEAGSDLIIYDLTTAGLHTLNDVATSVWRALETSRTLSEVVTATGYSEDVVWMAVTKLADAELLEASHAPDVRVSRTRREFLRKAAIGGVVAVPMVISTTAVHSAMASSECNCIPEVSGTYPATEAGADEALSWLTQQIFLNPNSPPCNDACTRTGHCYIQSFSFIGSASGISVMLDRPCFFLELPVQKPTLDEARALICATSGCQPAVFCGSVPFCYPGVTGFSAGTEFLESEPEPTEPPAYSKSHSESTETPDAPTFQPEPTESPMAPTVQAAPTNPPEVHETQPESTETPEVPETDEEGAGT